MFGILLAPQLSYKCLYVMLPLKSKISFSKPFLKLTVRCIFDRVRVFLLFVSVPSVNSFLPKTVIKYWNTLPPQTSYPSQTIRPLKEPLQPTSKATSNYGATKVTESRLKLYRTNHIYPGSDKNTTESTLMRSKIRHILKGPLVFSKPVLTQTYICVYT